MSMKDFLLVGERQLKLEVVHMAWSPNRDVVALATSNGDLLLYRLASLERVWTLPPPQINVNITALCWRPEGDVIAVAYEELESGIRFVYMEKAQVIWHLSATKSLLENPSVLLKWFQLKDDLEQGYEFAESLNSTLNFKDYIPTLPKLPSKEGETVDVTRIVSVERLNIMVSCDVKLSVTLFGDGVFPLAVIDCAMLLMESPERSRVLDVDMDNNFSYLSIVISSQLADNSSDVSVRMFDVRKLLVDLETCRGTAEKACHLSNTVAYLGNVLDSIKEACETVVQEMEQKLTNHLRINSISGSIGDEFLHFLLWGKPSEMLQDLFLNCLQPKGIAKLGSRIKSSYVAIQQSLHVNFQLAADALFFLLVELTGVSSKTAMFDDDVHLFDSQQVEEAVKTAAEFIMKANELQQVIRESLKNLKAFFTWLYLSVCRVHEPAAVDSYSLRLSPKELEHVADFIMESFVRENMQVSSLSHERHFNLDKVYQYLLDEKLQTPVEGSEWFRLVEHHHSLYTNPHVVRRRPGVSLAQLFREVDRKLRALLCRPAIRADADAHQVRHVVTSSSSRDRSSIRASQWSDRVEDRQRFFTLLSGYDVKKQQATLLETTVERKNRKSTFTSRQHAVYFPSPESVVGSEESRCAILDCRYYSEEYLTVLLAHDESYFLTQVSLPAAIDARDCEGRDLTCEMTRALDFRPAAVALCAKRNVACVLSAERRRVQGYEMDAGDDDDSMMT